ncbi:unnamed protein product [Nippostrongylus brasiliensis]|uniref:Acyl-CoA dehydrogenase family member 10 (inferred by orthology to a human protein) n=1 Tax=Nippostrongylus brasiliensis TaxID=27835 RepID=A0A0N4YEY0_NIPBR|nr:unnamed protein product [Nippostrongylus brasiliensis]
MKPKAVVFDMGGVLIPGPTEFWKSCLKQYDVDLESVLSLIARAPMSEHFKALECGEITGEDFDSLFTHFYKKEELRAAGCRVACLTNIFYADRARRVQTLPDDFEKHFDVVVESCRVGLRKPDLAIYRLVCDKLKVTPKECVFLDDLGPNVKTAKEMGFTTIKVDSIPKAVAELRETVKELFEHPPGTRDCLPREMLPEDRLRGFLQEALNLKDSNPFIVRRFGHGQSNPTYYIRVGSTEVVLRKKPSGKLLPKAHQVDREYRVLKALQGHVPVPKVLLFNETVLDTPFYLMEYTRGRIFLNPTLDELKPHERREVYSEAIRILSRIHAVDFDRVGLGDYGRKG